MEIAVETADLTGQQQALVDQCTAGEAWDVQLTQSGQAMFVGERGQRILGLFAQRQQFPLKCILIGRRRTTPDDRLANHRHLFDHRNAEAGRVHRDIAPADQRLAFLHHKGFEMRDGKIPGCFVLRQEAHRHRIVPRRWQGQLPFARPVAQQSIWNLDQNARAVAEQRISTHGASVI